MPGLTFPNETGYYREARDELLNAEIDLRAQVERVAALRRGLPPVHDVAAVERPGRDARRPGGLVSAASRLTAWRGDARGLGTSQSALGQPVREALREEREQS